MLRQRRSPARSQRKVVRKDQLLYWRNLYNWVGCLKILLREKYIQREQGNLGSKHAVNFSKGTSNQIKILEERVHREELPPKCAPHERSPCPPKLEERSHEETLHHERCARGVAWNLANNIYNLKNADKATRYTSVEARAMPAPTSKRPEEREVVVDSGASMRMLSKKDLSSDELDTLRRSRNPITVVTANGEVQTNEEAQVCVHDPDLVVLVQLLEETPAVCRLENTAKTTDIPMSGSTVKNPRLTKEEQDIYMQNGPFRTSCFSPVVRQFWLQFVFNIDIAVFVFNRSSPRATWRASSGKLVRITPKNPKPK